MIGSPLGVVGTGLIGGSIGLRARAAGARVVGYDRDAATAAQAILRGAVDALAPDLESLARASQTLAIALPVDATAAALERLATVSGPALVIDVASVKAPLTRYSGRVANFVGTHPMAGREQGGIAFADADMFENAIWAYMPDRDPALAARVQAFIGAMGAVPLEIDAPRHDAIVALTSHLPQALSVLLGAELAAAARDDADVTELCGPGMMSMLRLARSPETMWSPIMTANAAPLAARLRSLARALSSAADGLDRADTSRLMSYFEVARRIADSLQERFRPPTRS